MLELKLIHVSKRLSEVSCSMLSSLDQATGWLSKFKDCAWRNGWFETTPCSLWRHCNCSAPVRVWYVACFVKNLTDVTISFMLSIILHYMRHGYAQDLYSLCGRTSYHKTSWSLESARFKFTLFQSLWNLTGTSTAGLPRCLSNFRAIRSL